MQLQNILDGDVHIVVHPRQYVVDKFFVWSESSVGGKNDRREPVSFGDK